MGNVVRRQSGIELLRIVGMLLIMLGHFHLRIQHLPNQAAFYYSPMVSFLDVMSRCISTTGVGIFIAISGWFGIRFKSIGLSKYLFQIIFVLWTVYALAIAFNVTALSVDGIKVSLSFYEGYWFVLGYLGLYLISPILNTFIEHSSKREIQVVLLSYYLFQCYFSWLSAWYDYYSGYSIILFAGIYLTAAYLKKYPVVCLERDAFNWLIVIILVMTIVAAFSLYNLEHAARQIRDDNPLVILTSILFVLNFKKLTFHSKFVNWLAASCFAVYLIHYSPFVYPYIMQMMRYVYVQFDGIEYVLSMVSALLVVYVVCALFDQIRIACWQLLCKVW